MSIGDKGTPSGDQKISQKTVINILSLFIILNAFFCAYLWISHSNLAQQFHRLKIQLAIKNQNNIHKIPSSEYIYLTQTQNQLKSREELQKIVNGLIAKNQELQRRLQAVQKILYPPKINNKQYKQQLEDDKSPALEEKNPDKTFDSFDKNIINTNKQDPSSDAYKTKSFDSFDEQINIISQKSQGDTPNSELVQSVKSTIEGGVKGALDGLGRTFLQVWSAFA